MIRASIDPPVVLSGHSSCWINTVRSRDSFAHLSFLFLLAMTFDTLSQASGTFSSTTTRNSLITSTSTQSFTSRWALRTPGSQVGPTDYQHLETLCWSLLFLKRPEYAAMWNSTCDFCLLIFIITAWQIGFSLQKWLRQTWRSSTGSRSLF